MFFCNSVMSGKATYFISDLHLGAGYISDRRAHEAMVVDFLDSIKEDAATIYLVGDILDYWYEYKKVVPRGFVRFFGKLAELSDFGVDIVWLTGNHDIWLFDYLKNEIGMTVIDGDCFAEIQGRKFFISHGDALGKIKWSYKVMRKAFRNRFCQILYASVHPRWTISFATGWSKSSRLGNKYNPESLEGELRINVLNWAESFLQGHPDIDFIVLGHHHIAVQEQLNPHTSIIILGDWIDKFTYGRYSNGKFELKRFNN